MSNHVCHYHKATQYAFSLFIGILHANILCQLTSFIFCTSYLYNFHFVNYFHAGQAMLMYPHPPARVGGLLLIYRGKQTQCSHSDGSKGLVARLLERETASERMRLLGQECVIKCYSCLSLLQRWGGLRCQGCEQELMQLG